MNILYLSEPDPRMTHFGGAQRTNYIWRALQEMGDVYTMTFDQRFETQEVVPRLWYVKKLQRVNPVRDFFYKVQYKLLYPLQVLQCFPLATRIEKYPKDLFPGVKFDVVVCRYLDILGEMHLWGHPRLIVDIDDDPLQMFDTIRCQSVKSIFRPLARWIIKRQLQFLKSKIHAAWVSNPEVNQSNLSGFPITVLPNIAKSPTSNYNVQAPRKPQMISVGALYYEPNYKGVDRFLSDIWPKVHEAFPTLSFVLVGKGAPSEYAEKWKSIPNVIQMGFVSDLENEYEESLCSVVPVYSGGGTCIKTIESLSFGRVCLATPFGARGQQVSDESVRTGLFAYDSVERFLELLKQQVLVEEQRAKNEQAAIGYIAQHNSYQAFVKIVGKTISGGK